MSIERDTVRIIDKDEFLDDEPNIFDFSSQDTNETGDNFYNNNYAAHYNEYEAYDEEMIDSDYDANVVRTTKVRWYILTVFSLLGVWQVH